MASKYFHGVFLRRTWWTLWLFKKWCAEWHESFAGWGGKGGGYVDCREWFDSKEDAEKFMNGGKDE